MPMQKSHAALPSLRRTSALHLLAAAGFLLTIQGCAISEDDLSESSTSDESAAADDVVDFASPMDEGDDKAADDYPYMFFYLKAQKFSATETPTVWAQVKGDWRSRTLLTSDWYTILSNAPRLIRRPEFRVKRSGWGVTQTIVATCDGEAHQTGGYVWGDTLVRFEYMCTTSDEETCEKVQIKDPVVTTFGEINFGLRWAGDVCGGLRRQLAQRSSFVGVFDNSDGTGKVQLFKPEDLVRGANISAKIPVSMVTVPAGARPIHLFDKADCNNHLIGLTADRQRGTIQILPSGVANKASTICMGYFCGSALCNL